MKKSFLFAMIISCLLTAFVYYGLKGVSRSIVVSTDNGGSTIELPESDTAFGGLLTLVDINDTTPHYLYKKKYDSIRAIKNSLTLENNFMLENGFSIGNIGVCKFKKKENSRLSKALVDSLNKLTLSKITLIDSIKRSKIQHKIDSLLTNLNLEGTNDKTIQSLTPTYCISLRHYKKDVQTRFFIQNDAYYLAYIKWDSSQSNKGINTGHYERKQIPVLYSDLWQKVYIPVSEKTYKITNALLNIYGFLLLFYSILVLFVLPVFILLSISRGKAFTRRNILGLKIISYSLLFFMFLKIAEPFILHSIFKPKIPYELARVSFIEIFYDSLPFLGIFLVVFIILKAFQKGFKLQQEQDLTV